MGPDHERVLERLGASFSKYGEVDVAYLFGSRTRGEAAQESDWDFAILLSRSFGDPYDLVRLIGDLEHVLGVGDREVNLVVLNDANLALSHRVVSEGIIVFERDVERRVGFEVRVLKLYMDFKPVLDQMRKALIEEYTHGQAQ
ncbi:MAG: nucleotidyltransferase domain-containing protein [Candidatus Bathyarchaeia archaeon]